MKKEFSPTDNNYFHSNIHSNNRETEKSVDEPFLAHQINLELLEPNIRKAYEKATDIFRKSRLRITSFNHVNVNDDLNSVKRKIKDNAYNVERISRNEDLALSEILEAMIYDVGVNGWFGENTKVSLPTLYDDLFNGVDTIFTHFAEENNGFFRLSGLSVDITFGLKSFENKFENIKKDIENGRLGTIKYYLSPDGSFRGEVKDIPRLILGVNKEVLLSVIKDWFGNKSFYERRDLRILLLKILLEQCKELMSFAKSKGQDKIHEAYRREYMIFRELFIQLNPK